MTERNPLLPTAAEVQARRELDQCGLYEARRALIHDHCKAALLADGDSPRTLRMVLLTMLDELL